MWLHWKTIRSLLQWQPIDIRRPVFTSAGLWASPPLCPGPAGPELVCAGAVTAAPIALPLPSVSPPPAAPSAPRSPSALAHPCGRPTPPASSHGPCTCTDTERSRLKPTNREGGSQRAALKLLVHVLDQLQVLLVPLLDVLQQHLGLVSFQLQAFHLRGKGGGSVGWGWETHTADVTLRL